MCRQQVNYLLRLYSSEEQQRQQEQYGEVFATIGSYNRRNGGQPRSVIDPSTIFKEFNFLIAFGIYI